MKIWIMLVPKKSIRSFLRWRKERKAKQKKIFSFLVEQSPVKQSAFFAK